MINKYWKDVRVYPIEFQVNDAENTNIHKWLVFPLEYTAIDIQEAIVTKFENVKSVIKIGEYIEGTILK